MTAALKLASVILLLAAIAGAQTGSGVVTGTWGVSPAGGGPDLTQLAALPQCSGSVFDQSYCDYLNPSLYPDTTGYAGISPKITVCVSGCTYATVQAALNAVACGAVISIKANQTAINQAITYSKTCDAAHWIIIRSDAADTDLPAQGRRLQPYSTHSTYMGALSFSATGAIKALAVNNGSSYLWIGPGIDLSVKDTSNSDIAGGSVNVIGIPTSGTPASTSTFANHIVIDRSWIHGMTNNSYANQCVGAYYANFLLVQDSVIDHCQDQSAPTFGGGHEMGIRMDAGGPVKIYNNLIEADGDHIFMEAPFYSGSEDPGVQATIDHDWTISRNHLDRNNLGLTMNSSNVGYNVESKAVNRLLFQGNVVEHNWYPMSGHVFAFNVSCTPGPHSYTVNWDITVRYNIISSGKIGFDLTTGDYSGVGSCVWRDGTDAAINARYSILNNLWYNIGQPTSGSNSFSGWWFRLDASDKVAAEPAAVPLTSLEIRHNTVIGNFSAALNQAIRSGTPTKSVDGSKWTFTDNIIPDIIPSGTCGDVAGDGEPACWTVSLPGSTVNRNAFVGSASPNTNWPSAWGQPACGSGTCSYWLANHSSVGYSDQADCGQGTASVSACAIASGALKNGGSDGADVGADISGLTSATAHSVDGQW